MDKEQKVVWITKTRSLGPTITNSLSWISLFNGDLPEWLKNKIIYKPRALNPTMLALDNLEKYKKYLKHNTNQKKNTIMKIINFFKNLLKKKPKKLSVDGENFQRMGFGKKIWFKKIPCRYIYSKGDFDFFVREDKKSVIYFQSTYVDKVETVNMMSREKPKKLFKVKKDSSN